LKKEEMAVDENVQSKQDDPSTDGSAAKKLETLSDAGDGDDEESSKIGKELRRSWAPRAQRVDS